MFSTVSPTTMAGRPSFNRTRNSTGPGSMGGGNRSNNTDFGSGRNNDSQPGDNNSIDESPEVMLYLLSSLVIPSVICFLFLFYNFIRLPQLRTKATNLLIIYLLINNFIHMLGDIPFRLYFLSQNQILIRQPVFCLIWTLFDNMLTAADLFIMAFTSIERYLFVFHHVFHRRHKRLISRVPIVICFAIPIIWYSILIFAYPCRNSFDYFSFQCGTLCYLTVSQVFINFENFVFFIFPLLIIVVGNSTLVISVLMQKRNMKRQRRLSLWRSNLRMISQLMFIAVLYMSIYVPSCILLIFGSYVRRARFQSWAASVRIRYFTHLKYLVIFGCPFVILAGQTEMHQMLKKTFCRAGRLWRSQWKTQTIPMVAVATIVNGTTPLQYEK